MTRLAVFSVVLLLAACTSEAPERPSQAAAPPDAPSAVDGEARGAPVLAIESTTGQVRLGLTDEVLYIQLTDQARGEITKEMENVEEDGGLGGVIAGALSGVVTRALSTPLEFDLADIRDVTYDDGRLDIEFEGETQEVDVEIDDAPLGESFAPDDAERFVETFHELKGL